MKKYIIFISLLLFSCKESKKLNLEIINNEIYCKKIHNDSLNFYYNNFKFNNSNELYKFTNNINLKLSNLTEKNYLFYLNDIRLNDIYNLEIIIEDDNNNKLIKFEPILDNEYDCKIGSLLEFDDYNNETTKNLLKKEGYNIKENSIFKYYNQSVIINSNNSYLFNSTLSLPFVRENIKENLERPVFYRLDPKLKYTFRIRYKTKDNLDKILPKNILNYMRENNIEIYKESLESNRIPIILK